MAGGRFGLVSSILPALYRFSLGGPNIIHAIMNSIILPIFIGSLFHNKKLFNPPVTLINIKQMMIAFMTFEIIKLILTISTAYFSIPITIFLFIFAPMAVLSMGLMTNDAHRNIISRKELEIQSNQDPMTKLPNIRAFKHNVGHLVSKQTPYTIAMFDVDNFKQYNHTLGHPKGDKVLKTVGQLLSSSIRKGDLIARYGGEEFIICYSNVTTINEVSEIAERLRKKIDDYEFEGQETLPEGNLTVSMGISFASRNKTLEEAIQEADEALYESKKQGKNQINFYRRKGM